MYWYPRRVPGGSDAVPNGPGGAVRRHYYLCLGVAAVASMRRWLISAAVSAGQEQDLCRLGPTEKKAAARSDLRHGLLTVRLDLLFLAVRLGPSRSVQQQYLYRRQDLLCRRRRVKEMPVLHSAAAAETEAVPVPVCACHCHSQVGRPPAPAPSA